MPALGNKETGGYCPKEDNRKSAPQNTAVGSGSRPGTGKHPIKTSVSDTNPHTLSRAPSDWLK